MIRKLAGRPQVSGITEALMAAAEQTMIKDGYSALAVDRLVAQVGTTRPTFYRRFASTAHLAVAVLDSHFAGGNDVDTGSLGSDLMELQTREVSMFQTPLLRNSLPGLLEAGRLDARLRRHYDEEFIGPRRMTVARMIRDAIDRGEIKPSRVDVEYICDLLVGPILSRALISVHEPLDRRIAEQTTQTVLLQLGATDAR